MRTTAVSLSLATVIVAAAVLTGCGGLEPRAVAPERALAAAAAPVRSLDGFLGPTPAPEARADEAGLFWVATGAQGEYEAVPVRPVGSTRLFRVWAEDSTQVGDDLVLAAAEEAEAAAGAGLIGALVEAAGDSLFPVDLVYARLRQMGGYFSSADQPGLWSHPFSNRTNAIYVSTASCNDRGGCSSALILHELQHLLQYRVDPQQATWLSEGLSELAGRQAAGAPSGLSPLACSDFPLTRWSAEPALTGLHYRGALGFLTTWRERRGEAALVALATSPLSGVASVDEVLRAQGERQRFEAAFMDWAEDELRLRLAAGELDGGGGARPCLSPSLHVLESSATVADSVSQHGCDYVVLPADRAAEVGFVGSVEVPVVPIAGDGAFWWSNRLSQSHATLTRAVDLRRVSGAGLSFAVRYDIEQWYDWGYVAVSRDGGASWELLGTEAATDANPKGNNPGVGLTGDSGGWVRQTADLTPFAGEVVLLRFGYLTDDAYEGSGLALDDIAVPEIGLADDGDGAGWRAEGFVLLSDEAPLRQRYGVALIEAGVDGRRYLPLGADNRATWRLPPATDAGERVLLVCGLTRHAEQPAPYRLGVRLGE